MGEIRVRLRLLKEDGVEDYLIPHASRVTQIVQKRHEGSSICQTEDETNKAAHDVVARFYCKNLSVTLEPLAHVVVDPPVTSQQAGVLDAAFIRVPASTHYVKNFVYLRPHDIVNFLDRGLKIEMTFVDTPPSEPSSDSQVADPAVIDNDEGIRVHVKSSNIDAETDAANEKNAIDSNSDDEGDVQLSPSTRHGQIPKAIDTTPAKSRSAELTIKETPKHADSLADDEDALQYSTAPHQAFNDGVPDHEGNYDDLSSVDAESPLAKAQSTISHHLAPEDRISQIQTASTLIDRTNKASSNAIRDSSNDVPDDNEFFTTRRVTKTYGKRRSKHATPLNDMEHDETPHQNEEPSDTDAHLQSKVIEAYNAMENHKAEQDNALTSDIANPHDLAKEAATRTMLNASKKRKPSQQRELDEEESMSANKKQRSDEHPSSQSFVDDDEEGDKRQHFDTPELKRERTQSSEPEGSAIKFNPNGRSTQESGEEIVVAMRKTSPQMSMKHQKSSPEVIVKKPRTSETPSRSTSSSNLSNKVPKILLSNDCATRKSPAVKKWLGNMGATIIDNVPSRRTHFVCVIPKNHTLKSAKVLQSLVMKKLVVTEDWLTESKDADEMQDPAQYVHETLERDSKPDRSRLLSGRYLFFTDNLIKSYKDGWKDIQEVAKGAGAREVDRVPFNRQSFLRDRHDVLFFGIDTSDSQVTRLIKEHGRTVYSKEFLTDSIISGELELDNDAYKLTAVATVKKGRRS